MIWLLLVTSVALLLVVTWLALKLSLENEKRQHATLQRRNIVVARMRGMTEAITDNS